MSGGWAPSRQTGWAGPWSLNQDHMGVGSAAVGDPTEQQRLFRQVGGAEALPDPRMYILYEERVAVLDKETGRAFFL